MSINYTSGRTGKYPEPAFDLHQGKKNVYRHCKRFFNGWIFSFFSVRIASSLPGIPV